MWFVGVEVEQETSAPPPKKNPGSAPDRTWAVQSCVVILLRQIYEHIHTFSLGKLALYYCFE